MHSVEERGRPAINSKERVLECLRERRGGEGMLWVLEEDHL